MSKPVVSVLLPVYNTPNVFLKECIESILTQTFTDFELIIVNDASTDISVETTVLSYDDKRIRYYKNKENMGISRTRNKLLDLADGTYLAIMDHDDVSLPTRFEKQVSYLNNHPDVGVVSSKIRQIPGNKETNPPIENKDIELALMKYCVIMHPASMVRKSVLIDNDIRYEETYSPAEDYALWLRLIGHTKFHNIPEVLFLYRFHATNTSKTQKNKMEKATFALHALAQTVRPQTYNEFLLRAERSLYIRLCGIPLIKIRTTGYKTIVFLFNKLPVFSIKKQDKLKP